MSVRARKEKTASPAEEPPIEWARADPGALAAFDPTTKTCTMNCGPHGRDPRCSKERKFLCDDCEPYRLSVHEQLRGALAL